MPDGSLFSPITAAFTPLAERLVETAGIAHGKFIIAAYGNDPDTGDRIIKVRHVENGPGAFEGLVCAAVDLAKIPGANVYVLPALMRLDLAEGRKGGIGDVVGVLAAVLDFDRHAGPPVHLAIKLPAEPDFVVETS